MKRLLLIAFAGTLVMASCSDSKDAKVASETKTSSDTTQAWIPIDSAMMMQKWQEYMTVGEPHKMLAKTAGTWTAETTMWMADGAPPQKSTGSSVTETIYGGLYQKTTHKGDMMGMPFEGQSIAGYDNMKKEYFSTWIDNMGSGIMVATGQYDSVANKLTLSATTKCMNGQDATMREVFTIVDDNTHIMEMYGPDPKTGKEYKTMEIKYIRKK